MRRRSFLLGVTSTLAAPAVVRADSLMKLWVPPAPEWTMEVWRFIPPSEAVKELFLYGSALMRMQPDGSFGYVSHEDIRA